MEKQIVFLIFILVTFYILRKSISVESFKNRREKFRSRREKFRNKRYQQENNKEDFQNMSISNLFTTLTSSDEKRKKFMDEVNERERKRHDLIINKQSKNTTDSMKKFYALKDGFYDIIKLHMLT